MIRVMLVDDHTSFRGALAYMLDREDDIDVVAHAGTLSEAQAILESEAIDMALLDLDLGGEDGLELMHALRTHRPDAKAIILTGSLRAESQALAIAAGAVGVVHKSTSISDLVETTRKAAAGEPLIDPAEAVALLRQATAHQARSKEGQRAIESLTTREMDVLRALAHGFDNNTIAARLHISQGTVRSHVDRILHKLGVESRLQAVLFGLRHRFLDVDDLR